MKTATRLIRSAVLLTAVFFVSSSLACKTLAWESAEPGSFAGDPTQGVPRVTGFCGLEVTGTGHVVDNSPTDETTFIGRFYVYPKLLPVGTNELFTAFSIVNDIGSDVFEITYNGTDITIDATSAPGGGTASSPATPNEWNLVEFLWTSGGTGSLWVNSDATTDAADATFDSGTGSIGQVRLGAVSSIGTEKAYFDDYESHRSEPVGPSDICNADAVADVNVNDVLAVVDEIFNSTLAIGSPDCDKSAQVDVNDILAIVDIIF
jgi:hypothetical protein